MTRARRSPQRFQLNKHALAVVATGHPWIFRDHLSSASSALADGQWLRLYDGQNRVVGHGIYEAEGAIGIRVISRGDTHPDAAYFGPLVDAALGRRAGLREETNAFRAVHGESDGIPAVVVDVFGEVVVLQTYSPGTIALGRWVAARVARAVGATSIVDKPAQRRRRGAHEKAAEKEAGPVGVDAEVEAQVEAQLDVDADPAPGDEGGDDGGDEGGDVEAAAVAAADPVAPGDASPSGHVEPGPRILRGHPSDEVRFREGPLELVARPLSGQKSGTFLDLRGLRRHLAHQPLEAARVLNLFAYTGTLGLACEHAGATEIWQVDRSMTALELGEQFHARDPDKHRWICADVFQWLPSLSGERFEVLIVDPPSMTSRVDQIGQVLSTYKRIYKRVGPLVSPGGLLIAACCTSRVPRQTFIATVGAALGPDFRLERDLPPEPDHPVGFREAGYLKVTAWRRRG